MKSRLNKNVRTGLCVFTCTVLFLTGCGQTKVPAEVNATSLAITAKGVVTSYLVDVLDKNYYDVAGLTEMALEEVTDYNTEHQKGETVPVTMEKVETFEGSDKVVVTHRYDSADTYADFNESFLYYGTVSDAVGYACDTLDPNLVSVKDGTRITEEQLQNVQNRHVLITDARAVIYCPYGVDYMSNGAVYREDGTVDASNAEGIVMILMKK